MDFDATPASDYPLADLVDILNRGFENYIIPITLSRDAFLNMIRRDGTDLNASRVLVADGEPAGIALIARRGWTSRLAAMGIVQDLRGKGAGSWFMTRIIQEAYDRGEREMLLEVIEKNEPAVHLYEKCGFETIRRLIGFIRRDAVESETRELQEIDIRQAARLISQYGLSDLPWQLSGESIAQFTPPYRAYSNGQAHIVLSNPQLKDIAIWSLLVEPDARKSGLELETLKAVIAQYPGKTWHVPALLPEELGKAYERAGFTREELSQWQMRLSLEVLPTR